MRSFYWFALERISSQQKLGERLKPYQFQPNFSYYENMDNLGAYNAFVFKVMIDASRKWGNPSPILVYWLRE